MHRTISIIGIALLVSSLGGCYFQDGPASKELAPSNEVSSVSDANLALSDGITAPSAPTLSISASAGALNFKWFDWRTNAKATTTIKLYEYNEQTQQEKELDAEIAAGDLRFSLPVTPHRLAWDAINYRVEICSSDNCVSSNWVPVRSLLTQLLTTMTPSDQKLSYSFGDDLAINAIGNLAIASSPLAASAAVMMRNGKRWVQVSTLASDHFSKTPDSAMRVSVSSSGDTVAIASASSTSSPKIVIFDRLGENWIETASISPYEPVAIAEQWDAASMSLQLSDNGDRLVFAAQPKGQSVNKFDDRHNQVLVFDRSTIIWTLAARLSVPLQNTKLRATSASGDIGKIVTLSASNNSLYLHEYALLRGQWRESAPQRLEALTPSVDVQIISAQDGAQISVATWDLHSDSRRSPLAWKFEKRAAGWIAVDSIRLPPTGDRSAMLRLAGDASLLSLAVGWQAQTDANLAFYAMEDQRWQHQFSVPDSLNLNRRLPMVQSIAISANNSTTLIGTTNTGSGGVVTSFR